MGRKKKRPKNRKKKYEGKKTIIRGKSDRGDLMLELATYIPAYKEYHGRELFEGLIEEHRKKVIDGLMVLKDAGLLPPMQKDPDKFQEMVDKVVKAVKDDPDDVSSLAQVVNSCADGMTKAEMVGAAGSLLERMPDLKEKVETAFESGGPDAALEVLNQASLYPKDAWDDDEGPGGKLNVTVKAGEHSSFDVSFSPEQRELIERGATLAKVTVADFIKTSMGEQLLRDAALKANRNDAQSRQYVIDQYLLFKTLLANRGTMITHGSEAHADEIYSMLCEARMFEIPASLFLKLNHETDLFICHEAGVEYTRPEDAGNIPDEEIKQYTDTFIDLRKEWRLPEQLPFDTMYFGLNFPIVLSADQRAAYMCPKEAAKATYVGYLISPQWAFVLLRTEHADGRPGGYAFQEMHNGSWNTNDAALTSSPFIIRWLVDWINDHQTCVQDSTMSFGYRRDYKKLAKRWRFKKAIPSPYYTVYIKDEMIDEDAWLKKLRQRQSLRPRRSPQHQYDVRGTWVCRYMRGPLPLTRKLERQLRRDKRRKIFTDYNPDVDTSIHMAKRGIKPKGKNEWLAILIYWRSDHRRGPDEGPYIPSVRKSGRPKYLREEIKVING